MRAIVIREPGGPEVLELREVPTPEPSRGEVRVRVRATAVNRADLLQRMGMYPAPPGSPPDIPGLEMAGEVDAVGEGVTELAPGDRVFGIVGGGAYAEHVVVHARALARMPDGMSLHRRRGGAGGLPDGVGRDGRAGPPRVGRGGARARGGERRRDGGASRSRRRSARAPSGRRARPTS